MRVSEPPRNRQHAKPNTGHLHPPFVPPPTRELPQHHLPPTNAAPLRHDRGSSPWLRVWNERTEQRGPGRRWTDLIASEDAGEEVRDREQRFAASASVVDREADVETHQLELEMRETQLTLESTA
jgi:hypothetical protein